MVNAGWAAAFQLRQDAWAAGPVVAFNECPDPGVCFGGGNCNRLPFLLLNGHQFYNGLGLTKAQKLLQGDDLFFSGHDGPAVQHLACSILDAPEETRENTKCNHY